MQKVVPHSHPNQKPLSTRFGGRKGVLEAAFAGNAGSAQRYATATPLPRSRTPANPPLEHRLAEPRIRRYRRVLALTGAQPAKRQRARSAFKQRSDSAPRSMRSSGRVVEGARLESVYTSQAYRGFESHLLRHLTILLPRILSHADRTPLESRAKGCLMSSHITTCALTLAGGIGGGIIGKGAPKSESSMALTDLQARNA